MRPGIVLAIATLLLTSSCGTMIREAVAGSKLDCLALAGSTTREIDGITRIVGSVRNGCERSFSHVSVAFKLDGKGNFPVGVAVGYVRDLKPGETKEFETVVPVSRDATYRVDGINAF